MPTASHKRGPGRPGSRPRSTAPAKGSYKRKSVNSTRFYGILILATLCVGLFFIFQNMTPTPTVGVGQGDHVYLRLAVWDYARWNSTNPPPPDLNVTKWFNFTSTYNVSADTNTTVDKEGLPPGIYEKILGQSVGFDSPMFMVKACIDLDKNEFDDVEITRKAEAWGFPADHPFYNKTILVEFKVVDLIKRGTARPAT